MDKATLKQATVGIAGLGGLGSNIAAMLARVGVGKLVIADFDVVSQSNLNRQNYFVSHLGMYKTDATSEMLARINPDCEIVAKTERVTAENVTRIFNGCAVVCEAMDIPEEKAVFVNAVLTRMPDTQIVAASGMAGYASSNTIRTRRIMRDLYLCGDTQTEVSPENEALAPRVILCAAHQANMVLRLLSGEKNP